MTWSMFRCISCFGVRTRTDLSKKMPDAAVRGPGSEIAAVEVGALPADRRHKVMGTGGQRGMNEERQAMRRCFGILALLVAWSTLAGCGDVENTPPAATPVPGTPMEMEPAPRLSLGVAEGDATQEFFRVGTPFLLPEDRLVVPLGADSELRVFGPDGDFLGSLGRQGEGPGEFVALTEAWARGDTIEAFDSRLARITRFLPDGSVEVVRLQTPVGLEAAPSGALPDGWVAVAFAGAGGGARDLFGLHWFSRDGAHVGEVDRVEGMLRVSGPGVSGPHPLSPRAVVRVARGEIYYSGTLDPRIQVLDVARRERRDIAWEEVAPMSPRAALALVRDAARARPDRGSATAASDHLLESDHVSEPVPALWDFMVDELGFIWVCSYDPGMHGFALGDLGGGGYVTGGTSRGGRWRILSPDGAEVGAVKVPGGLRLAQITRDAVVGVKVDPVLGFESVHVHVLRRY
jgi:hypothetical protein